MRNIPSDYKQRFYAGEEEMIQDLSKKFSKNRFQEEFESAKHEKFDCNHSKTPLFDFACHYIQDTTRNDETSDINDLKTLLAMHKSKIQLKFVSENAINIDLTPPFVLGKLPSAQKNERKNENVVFNNELKPDSSDFREKIYNFRPLYWMSTFAEKLSALDKHYNHTCDANSHVLSVLPENFAWILQYFSSVMDVKPSELYAELLKVEAIILKNHPDYFGSKIRALNHISSQTSNDFKYMLSMSS